MNDTFGGNCGNCGAPFYIPFMWHGITPPTPQPSCDCWTNRKTYITTYTVTLANFNDCKHNNGWYENIYFNFLGIKLTKRIFICTDCKEVIDPKEMDSIKLLKNNSKNTVNAEPSSGSVKE